MKVSNICILTMGLFVGSVLSDDQVDRKVCPRENERYPSIVYMFNYDPAIVYLFKYEAAMCNPNRSAQQRRMVSEATTPEEFRAAFKQVCDQRPTYIACLAAVKADIELCLEGVERINLLLELGFVKTVFDVECEQRGERKAVIEQETRKHYGLFPKIPDITDICTWRAIDAIGWKENPSMVNDKMAFHYRKAVAVAACLEEHRGGELDTLVNAAVAQWADKVDRMMCWNEQDEKEVLCKTIIDII